MKIQKTNTPLPAQTYVAKTPVRTPTRFQDRRINTAFFQQIKLTFSLSLSFSLLQQTMILMLWAVLTSPTRKMRKRGARASSLLISGPPMRAPCLLPGTVAFVPSCCVKNALGSGPSSSLSYGTTGYKWDAALSHLPYRMFFTYVSFLFFPPSRVPHVVLCAVL